MPNQKKTITRQNILTLEMRAIGKVLLALVVGLFAINTSAFARSIDEDVFLKKLLLHVGSHVCFDTEQDGKARNDRLVKPIDVKFRSFEWTMKDPDTGRSHLKTLAHFTFSGGRFYEGIVRLYIQPKGGMFKADGLWIFYGNMDNNGNIETQRNEGNVSCEVNALESFQKSNITIPSFEFNPKYKD